MAQARLRIGVIGCGLIAQVMHLHYLRELADRFEIAALCDLSKTVVEQVGERYNVARRFTNWQDLLEEPLDAMMVLTTGSHAPIAIAAAEAKRHVFIEKPIAFSVDEGRSIVAAGEKGGVRLMVGYMKRYDPAVERLAAEMSTISPVRFADSLTAEYPYKWYVTQYQVVRGDDIDRKTLEAVEAESEARVTAAIGTTDPVLRHAYRRFLLDSMVHDINLMRSLLGEPAAPRFAQVTEAGVKVIFEFPRTSATMQWLNLLDGVALYQQEFAFYSPERRMTLILPSPFLRNKPTELVLVGDGAEGSGSVPTFDPVSYQSAFKRELIEFYECVTQDREPRTSATDAVRDVALCQAIIAAAISGTQVGAGGPHRDAR